MLKLTSQAGLAVLALSFFGNVLAAEQSGKGTVTYATTSEATDLKNGGKLVRTRFKGVVLADDAKSPLHKSSQDCNGTTVLNKKGDPQSTGGYCDGVDADGDIWLISWHSSTPGGSEWTFVGGTGKYQGTTGGGKTTTLLQATDRAVISWEGTWTTAGK